MSAVVVASTSTLDAANHKPAHEGEHAAPEAGLIVALTPRNARRLRAGLVVEHVLATPAFVELPAYEQLRILDRARRMLRPGACDGCWAFLRSAIARLEDAVAEPSSSEGSES